MDAPEQRIGDAERTAAMEALGEHLRAGRLDPHEYDDRVLAVTAARTRADLDPLFVDLPAPHPGPAPVTSLQKASPVTPVDDDHGPLFGRAGATLVAASPFVALLLFFLTGYQWWWFLLVPLSGAIVYGGAGGGRRDGRARDERHRGRDRRRDR